MSLKEFDASTGATLQDDSAPEAISGEFQSLPLAQVVARLNNARQKFDPVKLAELAESIKASGVHQPIIVRPLPGERVPETDRKVRYEIVAGERRYRASQLAGMQTIPALIRDLTDAQVLELQIVENLQREDLTALEEATGYSQLMQHSTLTAKQVGDKIGKSREYVYARLKLLDLGQDGRTALHEGKIDASHALLLARIPDGKLQAKALKDILGGYYHDSEVMSHREAQQHIQQNYMLKLNDARFKITAVDLVPGVGSCKDCSKRTGHDPDLFADVKSADVCTDPPCFHKKEEAAAATLVKEAKAKGQTVIAGKEAQELLVGGYGSQARFKGYKRLDVAEDSPTGEPLRKLIGKLMESDGIKPTMLEHPTKKGQLVAALPNDVANSLLQRVQNQAKASKAPASKEIKALLDDKKAKADAKAKALYEQGWRDRLLARTWSAVNTANLGECFSIDAYRFLALREARNLSSDSTAALCKLLDLGKVATGSALVDHVKNSPTPDALLLLMIMQRDSYASDHSYGGREEANEGLMLVAGAVHGDALKDVIAEVKAKTKDRVMSQEAKKAPPTKGSAARLKEGAGGKPGKNAPAARPKVLSAKDAQIGIADAMQKIEEPGGVKPVAAWPFPKAPPPGYKAPSAPAKPAVEPPADPLYAKALKAITKAKKANVRLLKEELGIGTTKALELMAALEKAGKVSPAAERGARELLV